LKQRRLIFEICGYGGMLCIIAAYLGVSFGWLPTESIMYQVVNLVGSVGNIAYYRYKRAYSGEILDGVWALVALISLARLISIYL
jgi:hypothetical protein